MHHRKKWESLWQTSLYSKNPWIAKKKMKSRFFHHQQVADRVNSSFRRQSFFYVAGSGNGNESAFRSRIQGTSLIRIHPEHWIHLLMFPEPMFPERRLFLHADVVPSLRTSFLKYLRYLHIGISMRFRIKPNFLSKSENRKSWRSLLSTIIGPH
jgi:hypothetical protein